MNHLCRQLGQLLYVLLARRVMDLEKARHLCCSPCSVRQGISIWPVINFSSATCIVTPPLRFPLRFDAQPSEQNLLGVEWVPVAWAALKRRRPLRQDQPCWRRSQTCLDVAGDTPFVTTLSR